VAKQEVYALLHQSLLLQCSKLVRSSWKTL